MTIRDGKAAKSETFQIVLPARSRCSTEYTRNLSWYLLMNLTYKVILNVQLISEIINSLRQAFFDHFSQYLANFWQNLRLFIKMSINKEQLSEIILSRMGSFLTWQCWLVSPKNVDTCNYRNFAPSSDSIQEINWQARIPRKNLDHSIIAKIKAYYFFLEFRR